MGTLLNIERAAEAALSVLQRQFPSATPEELAFAANAAGYLIEGKPQALNEAETEIAAAYPNEDRSLRAVLGWLSSEDGPLS